MKYELTVTLRPCMYTLTAAEQFKATSTILKIILDKFCQGAKFTAVAELTNENNIHYHCLLDIETLYDRDKLLNSFRWKGCHNIFGRKTCTQVKYEESYLRYMVKNTIYTSSIIDNKNPIICDYYKAYSYKYNIEGYFHDEPDYKIE